MQWAKGLLTGNKGRGFNRQQVQNHRNHWQPHTDTMIFLKITPLLLVLLQVAAYVHFLNKHHRSIWEQEKQECCIRSKHIHPCFLPTSDLVHFSPEILLFWLKFHKNSQEWWSEFSLNICEEKEIYLIHLTPSRSREKKHRESLGNQVTEVSSSEGVSCAVEKVCHSPAGKLRDPLLDRCLVPAANASLCPCCR